MQRSDFYAISSSPSLTMQVSKPGYGDQRLTPNQSSQQEVPWYGNSAAMSQINRIAKIREFARLQWPRKYKVFPLGKTDYRDFKAWYVRGSLRARVAIPSAVIFDILG